MVVGAAIAGCGYVLLGQVQELWQYYAIQAGVITVGMAGMGALVVNVAVSNWFVRRRGRAGRRRAPGAADRLLPSSLLAEPLLAPLREAPLACGEGVRVLAQQILDATRQLPLWRRPAVGEGVVEVADVRQAERARLGGGSKGSHQQTRARYLGQARASSADLAPCRRGRAHPPCRPCPARERRPARRPARR